MIEAILHELARLPVGIVYLVIGVGAAVENFIPPIPADTFVLLGAFLAPIGRTNAIIVFLITWLSNIASAAGVYFISRRYGGSFFSMPIGHWLIHPKQLEHIGRFYDRWGTPAIFVSRFLPTLRAMVPVFAGVTGVPFRRVFVPVAVASGVWYGFVVYVGATAGQNWEAVVEFFNRYSSVLGIIAAVVMTILGVWWWHTRRKHRRADGK